jgi:uncharacterized protein (UPF0335 family)
MNTTQLRHYINLLEARDPAIKYQDSEQEVVAMLRGSDSQVYTKLAQKVNRIEQLEEEIKALKEEVKQVSRENIADLFDADDAIKARVVQTMSFILTLSKDPKATVTPKYKDILEALSTQLTPELIIVLENLKKQMVTVTQKSPSLRITRNVDEGSIGDLFARFKQKVFGWATSYDQKLSILQHAAAD